jgi:hypothetical protein
MYFGTGSSFAQFSVHKVSVSVVTSFATVHCSYRHVYDFWRYRISDANLLQSFVLSKKPKCMENFLIGAVLLSILKEVSCSYIYRGLSYIITPFEGLRVSGARDSPLSSLRVPHVVITGCRKSGSTGLVWPPLTMLVPCLVKIRQFSS